MKPRNEDRKMAEGRNQAAKPRFRIEKLEERIAPKKGDVWYICHYDCEHGNGRHHPGGKL